MRKKLEEKTQEKERKKRDSWLAKIKKHAHCLHTPVTRRRALNGLKFKSYRLIGKVTCERWAKTGIVLKNKDDTEENRKKFPFIKEQGVVNSNGYGWFHDLMCFSCLSAEFGFNHEKTRSKLVKNLRKMTSRINDPYAYDERVLSKFLLPG